MPTNTYVALDKITLGSDTPTVTFTSIPSTYTDLVLVMSVRTVNAASAIYCQLNSDTGTNYSNTQLLGNGSIANSSRQSSVDKMRIGNYIPSAANTFGVVIANFQNYSNTTTNKTVISRAGSADGGLVAEACLWRSTAAISSILIGEEGSGNLRAGSTFSLYGIAATSVGAKATGGTVYSDSQYYYHVFDSTGTFTPLQSLSADVLCVAGGGGAKNNSSSGGGAGGVTYYASQSLTATGYTVTVGAGGSGSTDASQNDNRGTSSQFASLTASVGGGGGIGRNYSAGTYINGGSGAGATSGGGNQNNYGTGTAGQGNNGGTATNSAPQYGSGGGGGAGGVGGNGTSSAGGTGGVGSTTYSSWGVATGIGQNVSGTYYLAGGGAGGGQSNASTGGYGGGGDGGSTGVNGALATGGGGGAGYSGAGGNGGSGVVIVRYAK